MDTVYFITHPDVLIDPTVPVPEWRLNARGIARMRAMLTQSWVMCIRDRTSPGPEITNGAAWVPKEQPDVTTDLNSREMPGLSLIHI